MNLYLVSYVRSRYLLLALVESLSLGNFFFLMIRRPPRSTLDRSSAASDVYKRQPEVSEVMVNGSEQIYVERKGRIEKVDRKFLNESPVSYTHLRAHETVLDLVCRLLLETKNYTTNHHDLRHLSVHINQTITSHDTLLI